jgi:hypothetical protein
VTMIVIGWLMTMIVIGLISGSDSLCLHLYFRVERWGKERGL